MKAVLPVAGNGTRMYPLGVTTPKALIPILNKPLIEWTLEGLEKNGIEEVIVITSAGTFGTLIADYLKNHIIAEQKYRLKISIVTQEQQLGTAHVLQQAEKFISLQEDFIFVYGDDLYSPENIASVKNASGLAVIGKKVTDPEKWGIFATNQDGTLKSVVEKPSTFVGDLANIGCMKLSGKIFSYFNKINISVRGEYELTDSLQLMAEDLPIQVLPAPDYWIPIGYPWHILDATEFLLQTLQNKVEGEIHESSYQKDALVLPKSSRILPGCYLEGKILIGERVVIGPNARIRGNTVIGDDCVIGFSVDLKNSVIGEKTKIPHLSYVADSVVGKNCRISAGAVLANTRHDRKEIATPIKGVMTKTGRNKFGAILGDGVKLGVNTSVYPGRKIWPAVMTKPGQIVDRDLLQ